MTRSRKWLLTAGAGAGVAASIGILRYPGSAAQFTYKLGNDQPAAHPMTAESIKAAARVREATGGQLDIRVFPNSALGTDNDMLSEARAGALEFLQIGNNILASAIPSAALEGIPFAFSSYKEMLSAANGELGSYIAAQAQKIGLRKFDGSWYGGTFQTETRDHPVEAPADFKGLKIRVPPGPLDVGIFKAFGASPTVIPITEVYVSLQTHLVDAIEVPLATVENFKYYEQTKYVSMTNHNYINYLMVANTAAWQRLPKKLQDIVDAEFNRAAVAATNAMVGVESSVGGKLRAQGMVFNSPSLEPFRAVIRDSGLYAQWRTRFDPVGWKMLEKTTGKLA
ncbi:MAG TPA: TRAP transporter substrate-binding protein [Candidatus Dormibacteraeota bacterium]|nr:TRAP transporter substrate-binding protein [Candidatus Dormibacteraeota bacterium]